MNKKISLGVAIMFMGIVASIVFVLTMLFSQDIFNSMLFNVMQRENMYEKIGEIEALLDANAIESVTDEELINAIADGMVDSLDDTYADYMTESEYEEKLLEDKGELVGIGISATINAENGYLEIANVYENSPAMAAGIVAGDIIVKVDDEDIAVIGGEAAFALIRGDEGTRVRVTIRRDGVDSEYTVVREKIEVPSVFYSMIEENAYIKIEDFNDSSVNQFESAIEYAYDNNAEGIIIDLRDNGGGTVNSCTDMIDMIIPEGVIASVVDASGESEVLAHSDANQVSLPIVTITNGNTASAAELFVMALKDYDKANSVGETTFGKGVMQTTYPLNDGSAVKITTAYLNPPTSSNFNGIGIEPEYEVIVTPEEKLEIDPEDYTTDRQLMKAIEVVNAQ